MKMRRLRGDKAGKTVKKTIQNFLLATMPAVVIFLLVSEATFRWIIPAAEFPQTFSDRTNGILRLNENGPTDGVYTMGKFAQQKARWHVNNCGWNSEVDYVSGTRRQRRLVGIIGDSYVEGFQVDVSKNLASQLRQLGRGAWDVYSFGISGAPLSQYLQMSRYVAKTFDPDVLVINVVHNDFDESIKDLSPNPLFMQLRVQGETFEEESPQEYIPNPFKRLLRNSALARYLIVNLRVESVVGAFVRKEEQSNANIDVARVQDARMLIERGTRFLIRRFREENPDRRIVFMIDAPRADIHNQTLANSNVYWLNRLLQDACTSYRMEFIDLTPVFAEHYRKHAERFNSEYDGHWNELGHRLAAERVAQQLQTPVYKDGIVMVK